MAQRKSNKKKASNVENRDTRLVRINTDWGENLFLNEIPQEVVREDRSFWEAKEMTKSHFNSIQLENAKEAISRRKILERNALY